MKQLRDGKYQDTLILDSFPVQQQARTRASQSIEAEMMDSNVEIDVLSRLRNLCSTLAELTKLSLTQLVLIDITYGKLTITY